MYCRDICRRRGCDDEETTLTDEETRDVGVLVEVVMNGWTFDEHQLDWEKEKRLMNLTHVVAWKSTVSADN